MLVERAAEKPSMLKLISVAVQRPRPAMTGNRDRFTHSPAHKRDRWNESPCLSKLNQQPELRLPTGLTTPRHANTNKAFTVPSHMKDTPWSQHSNVNFTRVLPEDQSWHDDCENGRRALHCFSEWHGNILQAHQAQNHCGEPASGDNDGVCAELATTVKSNFLSSCTYKKNKTQNSQWGLFSFQMHAFNLLLICIFTG